MNIIDKKNRVVFIINNLDYFLEEFQESSITPIEEFAQIDVEFNGFVEEFIDFQLAEVFEDIMTFKVEKYDVQSVEIMLHDFNSNWKRRLEIIETLEKDLFISENSQKDFLKRTNTKLLMKYSDFVEQVKKHFPQVAKIVVSVHSLMAEIQR